MSFYEINFSALQQMNPLFTATLPKDDIPLHYEVFMDENSVESLNLVHTTLFKPLYSSAPSVALTEQMASFEAFQEYPYFYFFGFGNGVLLKYLLSNQRLKRIVVVEPDPQIAYVVLHMIDFAQEIEEGRLVILGKEQLNFPSIAPLFKELEQQRYAKLYYLHVISPFYEIFQELILRSNQLFIETIHHTIVLAGNDTKDALIGLKHHMTNLPSIPHTPPLFDLINKVNTTKVAVLVSTGPSLSKQIPLLKEIAPYVRIFAVDASLPILIKNGIKPDVVTSIERVALTSRFFKETPKDAMKGVVTVLSSLQHAEVIDSVQSDDVIISLRPLGYMRVTGPKEWGYIGIGMSAANMAYELIYHSHFKTCILIGQDLAYGNNGKSHASGHVFGEDDVKQSEIDGWTVAYGGEGKVKTTAIWNMFRGFFEKDIAEAKGRMETINATEGGARIFGAVELPFTRAIEDNVSQKVAKKPIALSRISPKDIKIITQNIMQKVESIEAYLTATQNEVEALFLKVAQTCDVLDANHEVSNNTMSVLLEAIEKIRAKNKEEIFDKVIWHIAQSMMLVQEINIAPMEVRYTPNEESKRQKLVDLMYAYKGWLFSLAGSIDAIRKTMHYGQSRALIHTVHEIGVWLGDEQIDTIMCKDMTAQNGRVFDVDMRGILYDVEDKYVNNTNQICFKNGAGNAFLPQSFVNVIDRQDSQYNKLRFMRSLDEELDTTKIKYIEHGHIIGFLVLEENLKSQDFMNFLHKISVTYPDITLKACYFNEIQKQKLLDSVLGKTQKIDLVQITTIYDLINTLNIFLANVYVYKESNLVDVKASRFIYNLCDTANILALRTSLDLRMSIREWGLKSKDNYCTYIQTINRLKIFDTTMETSSSELFYQVIFHELLVKSNINNEFDLNIDDSMLILNDLMIEYALKDAHFKKMLAKVLYAMIVNNANE